ncbi:LppU/SCO3897 family protein, partial [Amycolatopsis rhizosphaerae]|uniref:LppU/SCO3897 family protein n=1 Tax=Amycolatopsis rhizosphaerae TaxID=2053003 RepID=UPI001643E551
VPPGAYPPPPGAAYGPPPGTPVGGKPKRLWLRLVLVVVVLAAVGTWAIISYTKSPSSASAGDCLNVKEFKSGADPTKVDCTDPSANVRIGVRLDSDTGKCPGENYDEYSYRQRGNKYKLCLMLNAHDGDCFTNLSSNTTEGYRRVACTDPSAEAEIVKVVDGKADESACSGTKYDGALTYPQPPTTMCLAKKSAA